MLNTKKYILWLTLFTMGWIVPASSFSQSAVVKAKIDSTSLMIGEQSLIRLEIAADKGKPLQLPPIQVSDTLVKGVEVLQVFKPDTLELGNNRIQIKQNYLITSFDSSLYLLPPFRVISGTDTAYSNSLGLKVSTYPKVDTESKKFFDIKSVIDPKFVWMDYLPYILWILGVLLLGGLIWYIIKRIREKKSLLPFKKAEPPLPPYQIALNELDTLKAKKLWQQGLIKEYHSLLTDTLRRYIEKRFEMDAMEMTSGEILDKIRRISDADSAYDNLKQILILSDFVKFAKYHSLPDENDLSLMNAYLFVNHTKVVEQVQVSEPTQNESGSSEINPSKDN